jgi:hypothetical protein
MNKQVRELATYVKPFVEMFELEPEESLLLTASSSEVRFGTGVPGATSGGKWSSSPSLGNNAVPGARAAGKWNN